MAMPLRKMLLSRGMVWEYAPPTVIDPANDPYNAIVENEGKESPDDSKMETDGEIPLPTETERFNPSIDSIPQTSVAATSRRLVSRLLGLFNRNRNEVRTLCAA